MNRQPIPKRSRHKCKKQILQICNEQATEGGRYERWMPEYVSVLGI